MECMCEFWCVCVHARRQAEIHNILAAVKEDVRKWKRMLPRLMCSDDAADRLWSEVRLCHNDLHCNNVMCAATADSSKALMLVDVEYASLNYIGMDICNSLCNIPFVIFLRSKASYDPSSNFPAPAQVQRWLHQYLEPRQYLAPEAALPPAQARASADAASAHVRILDMNDCQWECAMRSLLRFRPLAQLQ